MGAFPNFFVVGAAKAATTSLYRYLRQHPEIYVPLEKELHFFSSLATIANEREGGFYCASNEEYRAAFRGVRHEKAVGEASPSYLWDPEAPGRIDRAAPNSRIIVCLRDPIQRAYSHYLMDVRGGLQKRGFLSALKEDLAKAEKGWGISHLYVELGLYSDQLLRYFEVFGRERVLVLFAEDLDANPVAELKRLFAFLGVNEEAAYTIELARHNTFAMPRNKIAQRVMASRTLRKLGRKLVPRYLRQYFRDHFLLRKIKRPPIPADGRDFLRKIYHDDILRLSKMLNAPDLLQKWNLSRVP